MSLIFTLKSRSSTLTIDFVNPIQLDSDTDYGVALLGFLSYNSIPNIEEGAKVYHNEQSNKITKKVIHFSAGSYEISDIDKFLLEKLVSTTEKASEKLFSLKPNNNTLKCEIYSRDYYINFQPTNSIGTRLGFSKKLLAADELHTSDLPVNIV